MGSANLIPGYPAWQLQRDLFDSDAGERRPTGYVICRYTTPTNIVIAETDLETCPISLGGGVTYAGALGGITYYDSHPNNSAYALKNIRGRIVSEESFGQDWEFQLDFSNRLFSPLSIPTQYTWDVSEGSETYFFDANNKPVTTSAGEPFSSLPTRENGVITLRVQSNVPITFDCTAAMNLRQSTNNANITIDGVSFTTNQLKVSGMQISPVQYSNGVNYRTVSYLLKCCQSWLAFYSDMGTRQIVSGQLVPITYGTPPMAVTVPWPLDGSGVALPTAGATPATLTFQPYKQTTLPAL